ncbi:MAG TPA: glycosyltransferase [Tepidisphaeraceae bacterium]|nr:glycosyltransferase [Tepidisphaeraceae bacterium]
MRILASNPDTIGDMVLRQPLYSALLKAGHELTLIVRDSVAPLVPYVAPGAATLTLPFEVYRDDLARHWDRFSDLFSRAKAFEPDAVVVAPYQWTLFEEKLIEELPGVPRFGMSGHLYRGDPHAGRSPQSNMRFDTVATVQADQAEVEKYAVFASAILGAPLESAVPRLEPDEPSLAEARQTLVRLGLEPNGYWIAAVAGTTHVSLKRWRSEGWAEVLAHWSKNFGRQFLLVGVKDELPAIEGVRAAMGDQADRASVYTGNGSQISQLLALTSLAGGYTGHDTGPMHIAAATGKPVLAVFGGGTWPRFIPAVQPSCSITVGVSCAGCGWACAFHQPHCIKDVPTEEVRQAVEDLENGKITGRDVRIIPASPSIQSQMLREASENVRRQQRETGEVSKELRTLRNVEELRDRQRQELEQFRKSFESRLRDQQIRHVREMTKRAEEFAEVTTELRSQLLAQSLAMEQLAGRLVALEPKLKAPREPWKVRLAKWIAGKHYYVPLLGRPPLPRITLVTPVRNGQQWIRQTVESVLGQDYPKLEYIVVDGGSSDDTLKILDEYRDRIDRIISEPDEGMYDAVGKGFDLATGDVLGYLNADDLMEPGGLLRVGEFFARHRFAKVIYHEDTVTMDGWRFPNIAQPHVGAYKLLSGHTLFQDGIFFRKSAYRMAGGINRAMKRAGDWELWFRLSRMWGLRRAPGHVSSFRIRKGQISENRAAYDAEAAEARRRLLQKFGLAGRLRCRAIQARDAIRNGVEKLLRRRKMFWPIDYCGKPYPPGEAPPVVAGKPISPLTGRAPDRLLFSTRDTRFGDPRIHYVYFESASGIAMAYPPMSQDQLTELYEKHYSKPIKEVIPPDPNFHSPYKNFKGGNIVARNLSRLPSPWWWFQTITYHDDAASEILGSVRHLFSPLDSGVGFLDVGCFEGDLLGKLKERTKWKLFGLEANANAVQVARSKGHQVWEATAEDAALVLPEDASFDLIFLGQTIEHLDDPLIALNRLKLLLSPGGAIVISVPNLDSKQVELFGPTWAHWHMPYHRTLLSRKALRRLAKLAGMRVERLRTRTHPYWTTMSVQLNRLGLGAVVPHTALFSNVMAMHGTRLTGWSRLLWDWRGRGDYMIAVLKNR